MSDDIDTEGPNNPLSAERRALGLISGSVSGGEFDARDENGYAINLNDVIDRMTPEQRTFECVIYDYTGGVKTVVDAKVVTMNPDGVFDYKELMK